MLFTVCAPKLIFIFTTRGFSVQPSFKKLDWLLDVIFVDILLLDDSVICFRISDLL